MVGAMVLLVYADRYAGVIILHFTKPDLVEEAQKNNDFKINAEETNCK